MNFLISDSYGGKVFLRDQKGGGVGILFLKGKKSMRSFAFQAREKACDNLRTEIPVCKSNPTTYCLFY